MQNGSDPETEVANDWLVHAIEIKLVVCDASHIWAILVFSRQSHLELNLSSYVRVGTSLVRSCENVIHCFGFVGRQQRFQRKLHIGLFDRQEAWRNQFSESQNVNYDLIRSDLKVWHMDRRLHFIQTQTFSLVNPHLLVVDESKRG